MRHAVPPTTGKIASMASRFQDGGGREKEVGGSLGRKQEVGGSGRHSYPGTYKTPAPTGLGGHETKVMGGGGGRSL